MTQERLSSCTPSPNRELEIIRRKDLLHSSVSKPSNVSNHTSFPSSSLLRPLLWPGLTFIILLLSHPPGSGSA